MVSWTLFYLILCHTAAAAAAKSLQSCPTLCDPRDDSPSGSPIPGILQAKNAGVGCHCVLQCMKVKSQSEVAQLCLTPSNPMDCSLPGSSIHGIFHGILEWGAIAFSEHSGEYCPIKYPPSKEVHTQKLLLGIWNTMSLLLT